MGVGGQRHAPAASFPGKGSGAHYTGSWVGPRVCLDGCENIASTGNRSQIVQPLASRCTDYAIPAHFINTLARKNERFCNVKCGGIYYYFQLRTASF
jgi:hypothetical protein